MRNGFLGFLALVGCGPDLQTSCENYTTAANDCLAEAYADTTTGMDAAAAAYDDACAVYEGVTGKAAREAADLLDCYAQTIEGGDCSTPEASSTTLSAVVTDCVPGV